VSIQDLNDPKSTSDFEWQITVSSYVNEDSGDTILRLIHKYTGKILYADKLTFNVKFKTTTDTNYTVIDFDNAQCKMENDTRNTSYWIVTVEDGHYASGSTDYTKDSAAGTLNLGQDWFIERDDIDRDVNLCIQPDGTETGWGADISYFACKEIWCEMQRKFTTLDYYDFDFDPNGVTENLIIATGDASLLIG